MKPLNALAVVALVFAFSWAQIERAKAESLELFFDNEPRSERNSIWKGDGSLVIIDNAQDSGYVIKDGEVVPTGTVSLSGKLTITAKEI